MDIMDFSAPELGDRRLNERYVRIVNQAQCRPDASFPHMVGTSAELEAAYRFFSNKKVSFDKLLHPHVKATVERCGERREVVVAHDTTEFRFKGLPYEESSREGLGHLTGKGQGFFLHASLAIAADDLGAPLGVIAAESWARTPKKATGQDQAIHRWGRLASVAGERLGDCRVIHVMDREADVYSVFDAIQQRGEGFVIRIRHNRRCEEGDSKLYDALVDVTPVSKREIRISSRVAKGSADRRRAYPSRKGRRAKIVIRAAQVKITETKKTSTGSTTLCLNFLHLTEPNPPPGEPAVDWKLLTTEPTSTSEEVERVIDIYRKRWRIEEFFKALKSGCAIESRQLESLHALQNVVAVMAPVAWHMLAIRTMARQCPELSAETIFSPLQLNILRKLTDRPPPENTTIGQAFQSIAALGGHIRNNGDPGWIVLGRGYQELIRAERVWRIATCDQS